MIVGAEEKIDPKALFAIAGTGATDRVILPSTGGIQEERPFMTPFFASAHRL